MGVSYFSQYVSYKVVGNIMSFIVLKTPSAMSLFQCKSPT